MILNACVTALHHDQYEIFDWVQRHENMQPVASALYEHSALASAVLHNAIRLEQSSIQFAAAVTRKQAKVQPHASPHVSAAEESPSDYSLSNHNMLDCIKAGYAFDDQCGGPESEKLWPHVHADNGLWIHHSGSIVVPDYDSLRQEIISELHDSLYAGHPGMRDTILLVKR